MASDLQLIVYKPSGGVMARSETTNIFESLEFVAPESGNYDVTIYVQAVYRGWPQNFEYYGLAWNKNPTFTFTGSISQGQDSTQRSFTVPSRTEDVYVELTMPSTADFDLSLWDYYGVRTGGWTSTDRSTRTDIPNSRYSGYSVKPEWVWVSPSASTYPLEIWYTGCYAFSGSGTYTIKVSVW